MHSCALTEMPTVFLLKVLCKYMRQKTAAECDGHQFCRYLIESIKCCGEIIVILYMFFVYVLFLNGSLWIYC